MLLGVAFCEDSESGVFARRLDVWFSGDERRAGLVSEVFGGSYLSSLQAEAISTSTRIANPGCYPTGRAILGMARLQTLFVHTLQFLPDQT